MTTTSVKKKSSSRKIVNVEQKVEFAKQRQTKSKAQQTVCICECMFVHTLLLYYLNCYCLLHSTSMAVFPAFVCYVHTLTCSNKMWSVLLMFCAIAQSNKYDDGIVWIKVLNNISIQPCLTVRSFVSECVYAYVHICVRWI